MELDTEMISLSKIRDGLFIADSRAGSNLDLLMQFKISHIINATGIPLSISFESVGIKYLSLNWSENPSDDTIINDEIINNIVLFIDDANINGEGLLGFSCSGKNRICAVIIFYLITKYNWPLKKCLEYVKRKKKDMEINNYYMNQLEIYEKKILSKNNIINSPSNWNINKSNDKDELVMRNTYMNETMENNVKNEENKDKNKLLRNIIWGDNKKYVKQMTQPGLIHYNIDKDLFLQKYIEDITVHMNKKPLMSCLKKSINVNTSININKINTTNKRRRTKIYLAADVHTVNNKGSFSEYKMKNNNTYCNESKENTNNEILLTQKNEKDEKIINNKERNIFEEISILGKNEENKNKLFVQADKEENHLNENLSSNRNEEQYKEKFLKVKNPNKEEHIINNLEINNNDSDDEIKLNIVNINNKMKGKTDENSKDMKDYGCNIINIQSKKDNINNELKPLINNLLKIDPNLETLNKYLKNSKKNNHLNFTNTFSNFQSDPNKINPNQKWTNVNQNFINKKNINIANKNIIINNVNLVPINSINTLSIKSSKLKENKEEKKKNKLYINNLNLNIENNNIININNVFNNNTTNANKVFINKKFNNYFMDPFGNYTLGFNKKKINNNNGARIEYLYTGNNNIKFLNQNTNYYLLNNDKLPKKENKKQTITIIPNIDHNNRNIHTSNSQKNNKKNIKKYKGNKNKIVTKHEIFTNNNKNNNNDNIINNGGTFLTNIINSNNFNSLNRKESKYFFII